MKGTKAMPALLLAGSILISAGQAALAESGQENLADLFYTYSDDNVIVDYYDADYLLATGELQQKVYNGFLTLWQTDLDWDGQEEVLAVRLKPQDDGQGETASALLAEVYRRSDNTLQRVAQYTLAESVLDQSEAYLDVFTVTGQNGPILCCEVRDIGSLIADGMEWELIGLGFDGGGFYKISGAALSGSDFTDEQLTNAFYAAEDLGLEPYNIVWQPLSGQVETLGSLCVIERYLVADRDTLNAFISGGGNGEGSIQYGETHFRNLINTNKENKMPGEFASVVSGGTAEVPEGFTPGDEAYYFEGDYVIPDSDSRYITEDDLRRLSADEILLARNEIYARHGRIFNNVPLNNYFMSKSWYEPTVSGSDFTEEYAAGVFNDYEIKNIAAMLQYERAHGLNDIS